MQIPTLRVRSAGFLGVMVAILLFTVFWSDPVGAAELVAPPEDAPPHGYAVRIGVLGTDNIGRTQFNDTGEIIGVLELDGYTRYLGPRFTGFVQSTVGYRDYFRDIYEDEPRATILASGEWMILPRSLSWSASELLTNAPVDPLQNASPSNVQFINAAETGPQLTARLGSSQTLEIAALYTIVSAEEAAIDHSRQRASLDWQNELNNRNSLGISLSAATTDFDNDQLNSDFNQATAFLTYLSNTEVVDVDFAIGMSKVRSITNRFEEYYETGRLRVDAQRTRQSSLNLSLNREVTDTAAALLEVARNQEPLTPQVVIGEPYLGENATLQYTRGPIDRNWSIYAGWSRIDFFEFDSLQVTGNPLDQLQRRAGLSIFTTLSNSLNASLGATYSDVEYLNIDRDDDMRAYTLGIEYRMDRRWSLLFNFSRFETISTDPEQTFTENQAFLSLQYAMRGLR